MTEWWDEPDDYSIKWAAERLLKAQSDKPIPKFDGRFRRGTLRGDMQEIFLSSYTAFGIKLRAKDLVHLWKEHYAEAYEDTLRQRKIRELERQKFLIDKRIQKLKGTSHGSEKVLVSIQEDHSGRNGSLGMGG